MLTQAVLDFFVAAIRFQDWAFRTGTLGDGFFLQVVFVAPDRSDATGIHEWHGRKWYISPYSVESEVVQTALKAVLTALEHEAREQFTYKGIAPYGPHVDVGALLVVAERQDRRREVART